MIKAVETLGSGFLAHPDNGTLRNRLASHDLTARSFYEQLIIIAFRYLFLRIADDLRLPHTPSVTGATSGNNAAWKEFMHACHEFAARNESRAQPHHTSPVCLWSDLLTPDLTGPDSGTDPLPEIDNQRFSRFVKKIANESRSPGALEIGRAAIPSGHLGYAYEALLALEPLFDAEARTFSLQYRARNNRRATGSFYTPALIVENLLDAALEPIISSRIDGAPAQSKEAALLGITVCDPSCGTGNFLIAAARRLAHRLAQLRSDEHRPDADVLQAAFCDVIRECIFGVDINPIAVELCKHALWIESRTDPSVVRSIDRHIKIGNALLGATPELIESGIPDGSCRVSAKDRAHSVSELATPTRRVRTDLIDEADPSAGSSHHARLIADTWCASFMWRESGSASAIDLPHDPTTPSAISDALFQSIRHDPESIASSLKQKIESLHTSLDSSTGTSSSPRYFPSPPAPVAQEIRYVIEINFPTQPAEVRHTHTASDRRTAAMLSASTGSGPCLLGFVNKHSCSSGVPCAVRGAAWRCSEPMSFLSSRDSAPRSCLHPEQCLACRLWVSEARIPGASVFVCAPHHRARRAHSASRQTVTCSVPGGFADIEVDMESLRGEGSWDAGRRRTRHPRVLVQCVPASSEITPMPPQTSAIITTARRVHRRVAARLPFRGDRLRLSPHRAPVSSISPRVTGATGALASSKAGSAPSIALACKQGDLADWMSSRLIPKIILATQTKIIEVFVDEPGRLLPSLPLITVVPRAAADIWAFAAATTHHPCPQQSRCNATRARRSRRRPSSSAPSKPCGSPCRLPMNSRQPRLACSSLGPHRSGREESDAFSWSSDA
ncbi:MAG: DNA methyltransferase [Phycisphaerales bacterium]